MSTHTTVQSDLHHRAQTAFEQGLMHLHGGAFHLAKVQFHRAITLMDLCGDDATEARDLAQWCEDYTEFAVSAA